VETEKKVCGGAYAPHVHLFFGTPTHNFSKSQKNKKETGTAEVPVSWVRGKER